MTASNDCLSELNTNEFSSVLSSRYLEDFYYDCSISCDFCLKMLFLNRSTQKSSTGKGQFYWWFFSRITWPIRVVSLLLVTLSFYRVILLFVVEGWLLLLLLQERAFHFSSSSTGLFYLFAWVGYNERLSVHMQVRTVLYVRLDRCDPGKKLKYYRLWLRIG